MILHKSINFSPAPIIQAWARKQLWSRDQHCHIELNHGARVTWPISQSVMRLIHGWSWSRGMDVHNIYSFLRRGAVIGPDDIHVDQQHGRLCHVSLVIPCEGSGPMIWYEGKYKMVEYNHPQGTKYNKIHWLEPPKEIGRIDLIEPTLCRVDIPHTAICVGDQPRITITIRFAGNPTFLSVCDTVELHETSAEF